MLDIERSGSGWPNSFFLAVGGTPACFCRNIRAGTYTLGFLCRGIRAGCV